MADNLTLCLRRRREERLCHGCSGLAAGIDGLKQQALGFVEQEETQAGGYGWGEQLGNALSPLPASHRLLSWAQEALGIECVCVCARALV